MKVIVNGRYTYETGKHKVKVGDTVVLPTSEWLRDVQGDTWEGKVTATESNYDGYCSTILKVKKKKA
jgi:hypothetical protein